MSTTTSSQNGAKYNFRDVRRSIKTIRAGLGRGADRQLQAEFEAGLHPNLLSYEKVQASEMQLPILEKYLMGATTFLHQPCNYYDIFRVCRCVKMVQFLNNAIALLKLKKVLGLDTRLKRLSKETAHDAFDAIAFEIITAGRYVNHSAVTHVEFIEESNKKTPDLLVRFDNKDSYVECKKVDRTQDHTMSVRNSVRDSLNPVIEGFRGSGISAVADVVFNCDPREVNRTRLAEAVHDALKSRTAIIESEFTVSAERLPQFERSDLTLYPSPFFFWHRYKFRVRSEWFGIVHQFYGSLANLNDMPPALEHVRSTWLEKLDWDVGIKWRISSEEVVAKYRRFAFGGVFKGLEQIQDRGDNSAVHLWLETDYYVGSRKDTFLDLFNRLASKQKDLFGWLMINETLFDVSPKGYFDFIEHAHMIRGPKAVGPRPLISGVFAPDPTSATAEFGVGRQLPDIDE